VPIIQFATFSTLEAGHGHGKESLYYGSIAVRFAHGFNLCLDSIEPPLILSFLMPFGNQHLSTAGTTHHNHIIGYLR
jgi:hypothetical protein